MEILLTDPFRVLLQSISVNWPQKYKTWQCPDFCKSWDQVVDVRMIMRPRGTWLVVVVSRQVLQIPPTACMKYTALAPRNTIRFREKYECSWERNVQKKLLCWLDDDSEELWKWFVVQWPKNLIAAELVSVYQTTYFTLQCSLCGIVIYEMGV